MDHSDPSHLDKVRALTDGRGVDLIIEMRADLNLAEDLAALARGGRIVISAPADPSPSTPAP